MRFKWEHFLNEFLCLRFGLRPDQRLMKVPVSILCKSHISIKVYLNYFLITGKTIFGGNLCRDTVIYLLKSLGSEPHIKRWGMVSGRTDTASKYTRTEGRKICDTYILHIQKGSSSLCANGQSSSIRLFGKNGRNKKPTHESEGNGNIRILFNQSDHT